MISKRRVPWDQRLIPPWHCGDPMHKIGVESMVLAGQIKISWQCARCKHIEEHIASTLDAEEIR